MAHSRPAWRRPLAADRSGAVAFEEFRVSISKPTLSRELRHMGFRKVSARPRHHAKTRKPRRLLKKLSRPRGGDRRKRGSGKPIEIWFQDEASDGQKNKVTRRWAKRGTRPSAPHDQRTSSAYIFGAVCPAEGKGAGLVLPSCNSEAMALSQRNLACGRTKRACARSSRSGRVACLGEASRPGQHHALAVAAEIARAQSGREHLAVHARQLALEPRL